MFIVKVGISIRHPIEGKRGEMVTDNGGNHPVYEKNPT
jgi:hypothetical protein